VNVRGVEGDDRGDHAPGRVSVSAARLGRGRAWLLEEVEAHLQGKPVQRLPANRLRHLYLDVDQYAEAVAVSVATAQGPKPDVARASMVGGTCYWLKGDVDAWAAANAHVVGARKARHVQERN
jgi:hypothetical protein